MPNLQQNFYHTCVCIGNKRVCIWFGTLLFQAPTGGLGAYALQVRGHSLLYVLMTPVLIPSSPPILHWAPDLCIGYLVGISGLMQPKQKSIPGTVACSSHSVLLYYRGSWSAQLFNSQIWQLSLTPFLLLLPTSNPINRHHHLQQQNTFSYLSISITTTLSRQLAPSLRWLQRFPVDFPTYSLLPIPIHQTACTLAFFLLFDMKLKTIVFFLHLKCCSLSSAWLAPPYHSSLISITTSRTKSSLTIRCKLCSTPSTIRH